jgi:hypothetical protein
MSLSLSSSAALAPRCFARRTRACASRGRVAGLGFRVTARRAEDRRNPKPAAPKPRIAVGVRHSMRVTRLRDLVEISPDLWAPSDPEHSEEPSHGLDERTAEELRADGAAQAKIFKELLLASQHFRLYTHINQTAGCGVRFLMGSPRMEGLDDVARVTRSVCESLIEDEALEVSLVPESGMLMAEIVFPLPKAGSNEGATPRIRETERVTALVRFLEEKIVHESVVCLMEKGSDDRSTFHGEQRLNKYFTGMYARKADLLHRGTCTSSSPTEGALEASKHMVRRLWDGEEHADVELMDEVRDRVEHLFCGGNGRMVIHPSGTDAETMPLLQAVLESRAIARDAPSADRPARYASESERGNVVSLVACAGEVGSGTTEAAMGRFFSKSVPLGGNRVAMGQELPALHDLADMDAVELVARGGPDAMDGGARLDYDELVMREARKALAADPACVVVLHTVAGSKTGLRLPSPSVAAELVDEFGARVVSVLDACQMRHHPSLIPRWLDEQGPVLMTSSKFFGGPSFGSGVFFPHDAVDRVNAHLEEEQPETLAVLAEACASYLTHHDIGDVFPKLHDAMPPGFCNVGVLLRWAAGLHEMETLQEAAERAGGLEVAEQKVRDWVFAMRAAALEFGPHMEYVPAIDYEGDWQLGGVNTIVSVRLRSEPDGPCLSTGDLKKVYALMTADISEFLAPESTMAERRVASQKCLTGQPVDIPGGSVLRTVLGAAQLKDLISGKQSLESMLEDDKVLLAKLALIARQYDYLLSHTL